jgi:hypothetical protein
MNIIYGFDYKAQFAHVLVRVYENQNPTCDEKEQCVGEVLFQQELRREPVQFTAWLPRGTANAVIQELVKLEAEPGSQNWIVGIANEFPDVVGVLTSCRQNFLGALQSEAHRQGLKNEIQGAKYTTKSVPSEASYNEWKRLGYQVQRGERSTNRDSQGVCLFTFDQVKAI